MAVKTKKVTAKVTGTFHDGTSMIVLSDGKQATVAESSLSYLRERDLIVSKKSASEPAQSDDEFDVPDGYKVTEKGGGWYEISGPEGTEPMKAHGADDVRAKLAEIGDGDEAPAS